MVPNERPAIILGFDAPVYREEESVQRISLFSE